MTTDVVSLAQRPDLGAAQWWLTDLWPSFMLADPIGDLYYSRLESYAEHVFLAVEDGAVVARGLAVPFALGDQLRRPSLPSSGWDGVIRWAWLDQQAERPATHLCALEITVAPAHRGTGLAQRLIAAMQASARKFDLAALVAPVRPSRKHHEPRTAMSEYAARCRPDGLPQDPWLRTHVRIGGRIEGVCPTSMTIPGTLADWRGWTGQRFDASGTVEVPGALAPVHVDLDQDQAVYVEPNVWVVHDASGPPGR